MLQARDERLATYRYLQTKYRALQEQYTTLRQHYSLVVQEQYATLRQRYVLIACAWCQRRLAWKRKEPAGSGETSHSICVPCAARLLTQLAAVAE